MENKQQLRKWAKAERSKLDIEFLSNQLVLKLEQSEEYKSSKHVLLFYPLKDEINLLSLLNNKEKEFYLPKINGQDLLCCPYHNGDETCISCFKTCEPLTEPCEKSLIDIAIIPALVVDKQGYRLGYGGGFYDRFLKNFNGKKIVCIPQKLIVETVYLEPHDIKADKIISA